MSIHPSASFRPAEAAGITRLRRSLIRLQDETRLLRRDLLRRRYDPSQPRVPAGSSGGGQWTSDAGGGGGSHSPMPGFGPEGGLAEAGPGDGFVVDETGEETWAFYEESRDEAGDVAERAIVNRDGSTIHSEYAASRQAGFDERHTVTTSEGDKVTFETIERTQTMRVGGPDGEIVGRTVWTPGGPEPDATIQPAFAPLAVAPALIIGGAILFNWQSSQNGDGQQAVTAFEANEYRPSSPNLLDLRFAGRVSQEEAEAACKYLPDLQVRLDDVVARAGSVKDYPSAAVYGTYVHQRLREQIDAMGRVDLRAEVSAYKIAAETSGDTTPRYGYPRTIRIDAVEYREDGTVCVYDFKTGRAGMTQQRVLELGGAGYVRRRQSTRAIVIQVRPTRR